MGNRNPEQSLINQFLSHLKKERKDEIALKGEPKNKNCKSKTYADVEYVSKLGIHWLIEAKSNATKDAHNSAHKIFGELLKETGRACKLESDNTRIALLIPKSSVSFYSRLFKTINRKKYVAFGALIPVHCVFICDDCGIETIAWKDLYPKSIQNDK